MEHPFFPTTTTRAEALRWLSIAEKLLSARDLMGSKSFASRARDSDPSLSHADQILAVADTLLAGDRRIGNNQHDWYAILGISPPQGRDADLIAGQYQSLSLLLTPSKNRFPYAEQAYRLVVDAWVVLSNPSKKPLYDREISLYPLPQQQQQPNPTPATNQNFMFFGGNNSSGGVNQPPAPQPRAAAATVHFSQTQEPNPNFVGNVASYPGETEGQVNYNNNDGNVSGNVGEKTDNNRYEDGEGVEASENHDGSTMWTACPYCYYMYEYPIVYADCVMRCQNCRKAFQAVAVSCPPQVVDGKNEYFCCWGLLPLGFSTEAWEKNKRLSSTWTPFSPMFTCPQGFNVNNNATTQRTPRRSSVPRVYVDDDEVFVDISDPSEPEPDDDEWRKDSGKMKKKARSVKGKGVSSGTPASGKSMKKGPAGNKGKNVSLVGDEITTQDVVVETPTGDLSKKGVVNGRKQPGRVVKNFGKLDLNVEFSNEPDESAPKVIRGNGSGRGGDEQNIEGIGFFEGLDEFLSSLPILNVVGDDKVVKAA